MDNMLHELINVATHGDSFDILPSLPDKCVDLILTDPPYDFDDDTKQSLHKEFQRVCKGTVIVFSPPENQWILPADQYLFWIKPMSTKNTSRRYSRFVEMIFVYGNGTWNSKRHWSQYTNVFMDIVDSIDFHCFRKPPATIERLIRNHTWAGDLILDPFAGSFVVAETARKLGRDFIAIEKEKYLVDGWKNGYAR